MPHIISILLLGRSLRSRTGGRRKTDCCKVTKEPPATLKCDVTICDTNPGLCEIASNGGYSKRGEVHWLEKRGSKRDFKFPLVGYIGNGLYLLTRSRSYPGGDSYMRNLRNRMAGLSSRWWWMRSENCGRPDLRSQELSNLNGGVPNGAEVEHPVPV